MDDILAKKNRHLFLEEKDNQNNSFIGNINDVANRKEELDTVAAHIANVDTVGDHIDNVDTVANNISDINDAVDNIATVKTFNDNVNNGTMQQLLEAFTEDLNEGGNQWVVRLTELGESIVASTSAFNYSTVVTVSEDIDVNGTLNFPAYMKYKVGTHMLLVSWNGTVCYAGDQYEEVGAYGEWSRAIVLKQPAVAGDKIQLRVVALGDTTAFIDQISSVIGNTSVVATGSTEDRTLADRFTDVVNVKDFGAKGDGETDDTLSLQQAINYALLTGKPLVLDKGEYCISEGLYIRPQEITPHYNDIISVVPGPMNFAYSYAETITIIAYGGARISATETMNAMITVTDPPLHTAGWVQPQSIRIIDLQLDGNNVADIGIELHWTYRNSFQRIRMQGVNTGFYTQSSAVNYFEHCIISAKECCINLNVSGDNKIIACDLYPQKIGVACGDGSNTQIDNSLFTGEVFEENTIMKGVELFHNKEQRTWPASRDIVIQNCEFIGLDYAIYGSGYLTGEEQNTNTKQIYNIIIKGNHTVRSSYKPDIIFVYIDNAFNVIISNNNCGGVSGATTENNEVYLKNCTCGIIASNTFINYKNTVIYLDNTSNVDICNNTFLNAVIITNDNLPVVFCKGNYNLVTNNTVRNLNSSVTFTNNFATESTGGYIKNVFKDNTLDTCFTNPYISPSYESYAKLDSFATATPNSGSWKAGDVVWNRTPSADNPILWLCTSGGTPGTWRALYFPENATGINHTQVSTVPDVLTRDVDTSFLHLNSGSGWHKGAEIYFYGKDHATNPGEIHLYARTGDSPLSSLICKPDGSLSWNGQSIQTSSDARLKTSMQSVPDEVFEAWRDVRFGEFKFLDAVERKGENARRHLGLIAQKVKEVFDEHNVDILKYGVLCKIEFEDPEFSDGIWTIRYEEALALECAYQRWLGKQRDAKIEALMQRISALENNH